MKYRVYLMLLVLVMSLSGCGRESSIEEETMTQTDTIETLHITIEEEILEKQEGFYKISEDFNKYLVDYSAYGIDITPTFFVQLFEENGEERYYLKASGDGTPYTSEIISYDLGNPLLLLKSSEESYLVFNYYKDASVITWDNGTKDGLFFNDEALNEIQPKNLVNAISVSDFIRISNLSEENVMALLEKNNVSIFVETYENELQTLADIEADWTNWKHSTYFDENGTIYEGVLTEEYIVSALSDDSEIARQKERDLFVEKESLGVQKVYQIMNEDGTVSYVSQDGNDMVIKETEQVKEFETEDAKEIQETEISTEEFTEEDISESQEIILPVSLFDESGVEYVFYSETKNIDDNGNVYYEIMPLHSLQSLISYIKVYYEEPTNELKVSGIQFVEKEYENTLEDYFLSLEDITLNRSKNAILTIGGTENSVKFYLYDPDGAYINKKIFTLDKEKSAIYAVIKKNEFLNYIKEDTNYKEISYEEFNIIKAKINEFVVIEESIEISTEEMTEGVTND